MSGASRILPDTNAILRYLLKDNEEQFAAVEPLFEEIREGTRQAIFLESVLVECVYMLTKFYKVPKKESTAILSGLLRYKGVVNDDREALLAAFTLYAEKNLDPVDCVVAAKARHGAAEVFTFDKRLLNLLK